MMELAVIRPAAWSLLSCAGSPPRLHHLVLLARLMRGYSDSSVSAKARSVSDGGRAIGGERWSLCTWIAITPPAAGHASTAPAEEVQFRILDERYQQLETERSDRCSQREQPQHEQLQDPGGHKQHVPWSTLPWTSASSGAKRIYVADRAEPELRRGSLQRSGRHRRLVSSPAAHHLKRARSKNAAGLSLYPLSISPMTLEAAQIPHGSSGYVHTA